MEDLTTYSEVDGNAKLTVTSTTATLSGGTDNTLYSLYKDKGADYFDALDFDFEFRLNTTVQTDSMIALSLVNTATPSTYSYGASGADDLHIGLYWYNALFLRLIKGQWVAQDNYNASVNTTYYCTVTRDAGGDVITLKVYSDSARTTLLDTLTLSGFSGLKWRYIYALTTTKWNENNALNGVVANVNIRTSEEAPRGGFILTMI
jgi:hypothetical protein